MPDHYQVAFDFIRVVSFTTILLGHIAKMLDMRFPANGFALRLIESVRYFGTYGTIAFFALASFYLCRTLIAGEGAWPALARRLERVYPPYFVMTMVYVVILSVLPWGDKMPTGVSDRAFYVLSNLVLLPSLAPLPSILAVGRAVGCVVWAYLLIALAYNGLKIAQWPRAWRVVLWLAIGAVLRWGASAGLAGNTGIDLYRVSGFAIGGLGAELWYPLGTWIATPGDRRLTARCLAWCQSVAQGTLGTWLQRFLELRFVGQSARFMAKRAYHTLLTHGVALHSIQISYPFGHLPDVLDLALVIALSITISFVAAWVLAEAEQGLCRWVGSIWQNGALGSVATGGEPAGVPGMKRAA